MNETTNTPEEQEEESISATAMRIYKTQKQVVLDRLLDMEEHKCFSFLDIAPGYKSCVWQLRNEGYRIKSTIQGQKGARIRYYRLLSKIKGPPRKNRFKLYLPIEEVHALAHGVLTKEGQALITKALLGGEKATFKSPELIDTTGEEAPNNE
jgi:hypothetical protein